MPGSLHTSDTSFSVPITIARDNRQRNRLWADASSLGIGTGLEIVQLRSPTFNKYPEDARAKVYGDDKGVTYGLHTKEEGRIKPSSVKDISPDLSADTVRKKYLSLFSFQNSRALVTPAIHFHRFNSIKIATRY